MAFLRISKDNPEFTCKSVDKKGYCTSWGDTEQYYIDQKKNKDGEWCDNVRAQPLICVVCPKYEPKKRVN